MESLFAIGVGLALRIVVDVATDNDDRVSGVLVGLWEGVVLNHFVQRMPHSFDPYLGFGFRIFVDFLFTQSLSRLTLVALWALVGMLLADIAPNFWRDSGLRHIYRQVRKDVRHVKRAVPRIRIKNDLPSVRLFNQSRSTSSEVAGSIRSDRATPSQSPARPSAPTPGPARRPGHSPPGTFPDVSGWSETGTDISGLRGRIVTTPGPSPALIPLDEDLAYPRIDAIHVATSQTRTATVQNTTVTITQTQNESVLLESAVDAVVVSATAASTSLGPIGDSLHHDPPTIPDDWVDVSRPTPTQPNEPVAPFQPDPDSTPEAPSGPSIPVQSRSTSIFDPPPAIAVPKDISDVDATNKGSRPPAQVPLPDSRAASVIGGVYDQPQPRGALHGIHLSHVDKATSEIGISPFKSFAPLVATQSTKGESVSRKWTGLATSWRGSKLEHTVDADALKVPPKEAQGELVDRGKLDVSGAIQGSEPPLPTPAQVDTPANILTQPGDTPPLLFKSAEPASEQRQEKFRLNKPDQTPASSAIVDSSSVPLQGGADEGGTTEPRKTSLFNLPSPSRTPPPPFTEFAGVSEDPTVQEVPAEQDPVTQDEVSTELTMEQKTAEEKRLAFLSIQVKELEESCADLKRKLDREDDSKSHPAKAIESDLEDTEKALNSAKARIAKTKFTDPPPNPLILDVFLTDSTVTEAQYAIASAILRILSERDDAGPMTIRAVINRQRPLKGKAKDVKDAIVGFGKRHKFSLRPETATPGIVNITF